jgi:type IV pilus assembly protein PilB
MAQRLVRKLCEECKRRDPEADPNKLLRLGFTREELAETVFYDAVGCKSCVEGFKGRVAITEALLFNKEIRAEILGSKNGVDEELIRGLAVDNGMLTLTESGKERIKQGLTTMDEIIAATFES